MTKEELLHDLFNETYVMLKPSPIHGIGVFAIKNIPEGCRSMFSREPVEWIRISKQQVASLPAHSRFLVETYCLYDSDDYFVPGYGFKVMDLTSYLNHSDTPNVISINEGEEFEAIVPIAEGEELVIDYNTLAD